MPRKVALVAGATGVVGRALLEYLEGQNDWDIVAVSRRAPDFPSRAWHLSIDLADAGTCARALSEIGATHLFYTALASRSRLNEEIASNLAMLRNIVEALESRHSELRHIQLMQGSKWY